jgi:small subunit ribosomal protein S18
MFSSGASNPLHTNPIADPRQAQRANNTLKVSQLIREASEKRRRLQQQPETQSMGDHFLAQDYSKQITRRWRAGDIYAPHDLSGVEMMKWKKRSAPTHDVFDVLNFNPEQHYRVLISS